MKYLRLTSVYVMVLLMQGTRAEEPQASAASSIASATLDPAVVAELVGVWENQLGSTLTIQEINPTTGRMTGTYKSPSGTSGQEYRMIGWVNYAPPTAKEDNVIVVSFSVRWGQIGSVTAWNGYYRAIDGKPSIIGQWLLVRPNSNFSWDHTFTGLDTFHQVK